MSHKRSKLTPQNYSRAIISLSRRYSSTSAFPGNSYAAIGEWMLQDSSLLNSTNFASTSEHPYPLVVIYNNTDRKWDIQEYTQSQHEAFSATDNSSDESSGEIVFIRGFLSPVWVSTVGSKYNIDPEYFRRHMDFLSVSIDRHAYSLPSLPNSSNNIFRVCINTIFHRDDFGGQHLQLQRSRESTALGAYRIQQLGSTKVCCGDSLVREYCTICPCFSVMEQWISLYISKRESKWTVIAWMDHGRPLEKSPPGPWSDHIESKAMPLPILQHHPKMAFRNTSNRLDPDANVHARVQQSTTIIPLQYDSLISLVDLARYASQDPLTMCIPLFAHAAFSEIQFLNLIESRIQTQINSITEGVPADLLGSLQYFSNILNRHAQQLKDNTFALERLASYNTRLKVETETIKGIGSSKYDGTFTPRGIIEDYEYLYIRCVDLSKMCAQGITLAMNKAMIEESRKAIEQSERLKKLSMLATLFIPLSFSASLFGMNIDLLGQSPVQLWWFFVLCIPITLFAYIFYLWDFRLLKRRLIRFRIACYGFWKRITVKTNKKHDEHIV